MNTNAGDRGTDKPVDAVQTIAASAAAVPTREECIKAAAVPLAQCYRVLYTYPIEEAARRALRPGGPTYEELLVRIAAKRAANLHSSAR